MPFPKQPETRRLLQSAQVALPLTPDPLADLAAGLRMERREVAAALGELQQDGAVLGVHGEANVAISGACEEYTGPDPASAGLAERTVIRWQATDDGGQPHASRFWLLPAEAPPGALPSRQRFHKAGYQLFFDDGPEQLLRPGNERTLLVWQEEELPPPELPTPAARLAGLLERPLRFDPAIPITAQLAGAARLDSEEVLPALRYLLQAGRFRRFALALSPAALGWEGCGLAVWRFARKNEEDLIPQAAAALAALRGTGDVVRRGTELHALFLGRAPGSGEMAANEVARQWDRPLARWVGLRLQAG